jgi:hypothetical protein
MPEQVILPDQAIQQAAETQEQAMPVQVIQLEQAILPDQAIQQAAEMQEQVTLVQVIQLEQAIPLDQAIQQAAEMQAAAIIQQVQAAMLLAADVKTLQEMTQDHMVPPEIHQEMMQVPPEILQEMMLVPLEVQEMQDQVMRTEIIISEI